MKHLRFYSASTLIFGLASISFGQISKTAPNEIMIRTRGGQAPALLKVALGATETIVDRRLGLSKLTISTSSVRDGISLLRRSRDVVYAEPRFIPELDHVPNDPQYSAQYGHQMVKSEPAWNIFKGRPTMVVAVLDTGLRTTHEDIVGRIAPGGFDFGDNDSDVTDTDGHGSHCIGIIGANTNNGKGVASVAYNTRVLPIKVFGSSPTGDPVVQGIMAAADRGAKVISMSFGTYTFPQAWQDAVNYAWGKGCLLFATAGNDNINMKRYPGACDNVITMGSTDQNDQKSGFSNFGDWVKLAAPGSGIRSFGIASDSSYVDLSGTSMACPFAASVGALVWGRNPFLSNAQVRDILLTTADPVGTWLKGGRVNALKAVTAASPLVEFSSTTLMNQVGVVRSVTEGSILNGFGSISAAAASTNATDAGRFMLRATPVAKVGNVASIESIVRLSAPRSAIRSARIEIVSKAPIPVTSFVHVFNYWTGNFELVGTIGNNGTERTQNINLDVNRINEFVNSSGHVRILVRSISPQRVGTGDWTVDFNRLSVVGGFEVPVTP